MISLCYDLVMQDYENSALFWQKVETLYLSGEFKIAHKRGEKHPKNKTLVFPCDYGYVKNFNEDDEESIGVYKGTNGKNIEAVVVCADILKKALEVKILIGLTEEETEALLRFMNQSENMKTVLIKRGKKVPSWAQSE